MDFGPRTLTLVPTALHAEQEVEGRLDAAGALVGPAVLTMAAFEERLASHVLGPGSRISDLSARLLVRRVLRETYPADDAGYFAPVRRAARFADRLRDLFGQLARALVHPHQLRRVRLDGRLGRKARELADLYAAYEAHLDRLERGDPAARVRQLVGVLWQLVDPPGTLARVERVVAVGRDRWLPSDAALLAAVARFVPVEVRLPASADGRDRLFSLVTRSADALSVAAHGAGTPLEVRREASRGDLDVAPPLAALCARLFAAPDAAGKEAIATAGTLAFVEAPGRREEAEAAVREVRRALEAGTPADRVAIVARDLDRYGRLVAEALERARVPFRFRRGAPLAEAPLARAVLALAALPARRFDLDGLLGVFAGGYVDLDGDEPGRLERTLNALGRLDGAPAEYARDLDALAAGLEADGRGHEAARVRAVRGALVPLLERVAGLDRDGTLADHVARLGALLDAVCLAERAGSGDERRQRQDAAALERLGEALDALGLAEAELGEPVVLSFEAFREMLEAALAERFVLPPGDRPVEAVRVLAATDVAGLRFDLVCLLGLVEGEFPRRPPVDAVLREPEVERLALALAPYAPFETPAEARAAEPFYLYRVATAACRRLVLSAPAEDERGRPLLHSSLLEEVARAVDPGARARHAAGDPLAALRVAGIRVRVGRRPVPATFEDCLTPAEAEARLAWLGAGLPEVARARGREAVQTPDYAAALEAALAEDPLVARRLAALRSAAALAAERDAFFGSVPGEARRRLAGRGTGVLETEVARAALARALAGSGEIHLSASALEAHAQCAYRWFLRTAVGLEETDRPRRDLEAHEQGTLLHRVLERGYRACHAAGLTPIGGPADPEGRRAEAVMLAETEAVLRDWHVERAGMPAPLRDAEAESVRAVVRGFVRDEASRAHEGWVPVAFEHAFGIEREGRPADAPPLRIPLEGVTAVLRGAIDRVDAAPGRLRVVDYKRSARGDAFDERLAPEALGTRSFQVPIYLLAAEALRQASPERFPPGEVERREAAYHLVRKAPDLRSATFDDAGYFALDPAVRAERRAAGLPNFANQLEDRVRDALSGRYEITPDPDCGYCPYGAVCRVVVPLPRTLP